MDKLFLKGLQLEAMVGVYPEERLAPQVLNVDIEISINARKAALTDALSETLDYDYIAQCLAAWSRETTFFLLESLADYLAQKIVTEFGDRRVRLRLSKQSLNQSGRCIGVEIERP
ncbi:MAG: dihydroneopterin aldolase [Gammaproteobacteria bacterium]